MVRNRGPTPVVGTHPCLSVREEPLRLYVSFLVSRPRWTRDWDCTSHWDPFEERERPGGEETGVLRNRNYSDFAKRSRRDPTLFYDKGPLRTRIPSHGKDPPSWNTQNLNPKDLYPYTSVGVRNPDLRELRTKFGTPSTTGTSPRIGDGRLVRCKIDWKSPEHPGRLGDRRYGFRFPFVSRRSTTGPYPCQYLSRRTGPSPSTVTIHPSYSRISR